MKTEKGFYYVNNEAKVGNLGACLQSQLTQGYGGRLFCLRPAWATSLKMNKQTNKSSQIIK